MSRARNIKPGFFKNDVLADCPLATRLLFIALWCEADREGRLEYRPKRIKAACLPYDDVNVEDAIAALTERGFLTIYDVAGVQYIQVNNWAKHQNPHHKEIGSEIPAPPGHIDTVCSGYIPLSNTIRNRIYARDGRVCKECGATHGLSIDHIIPVSRGGNSTDDNLQVLCLGCNVRKGNKFHASTMDESCTDQGSTKQVASCPTDSLIPDSPSQDQKPTAPSDSRSTPEAAEPPVVSIPTNGGDDYGITAQQIAEFATAYPAVDIVQSLRAARVWCLANPTKRKTRRGVMRFVNAWLSREQDKPHIGGSHGDFRQPVARQSLADEFLSRAAAQCNPNRVPVDADDRALRQPLDVSIRQLAGGHSNG